MSRNGQGEASLEIQKDTGVAPESWVCQSPLQPRINLGSNINVRQCLISKRWLGF